jgi:hypothetical protein
LVINIDIFYIKNNQKQKTLKTIFFVALLIFSLDERQLMKSAQDAKEKTDILQHAH